MEAAKLLLLLQVPVREPLDSGGTSTGPGCAAPPGVGVNWTGPDGSGGAADAFFFVDAGPSYLLSSSGSSALVLRRSGTMLFGSFAGPSWAGSARDPAPSNGSTRERADNDDDDADDAAVVVLLLLLLLEAAVGPPKAGVGDEPRPLRGAVVGAAAEAAVGWRLCVRVRRVAADGFDAPAFFSSLPSLSSSFSRRRLLAARVRRAVVVAIVSMAGTVTPPHTPTRRSLGDSTKLPQRLD